MTAAHPRENVWEYPRPPRLERVSWPVRIEHRGVVIADTDQVHRVLETTHPPVYYIARDQIADGCLRLSRQRTSWCEWKGRAHYVDLVAGDDVVEAAGWFYPSPNRAFAEIANAVAIYASKVDACWVDGECVEAQAGDFYGGWITSWIDGGERGFKGATGTWGW